MGVESVNIIKDSNAEEVESVHIIKESNAEGAEFVHIIKGSNTEGVESVHIKTPNGKGAESNSTLKSKMLGRRSLII